jgi:mono/diheme cytochrome c family protein
MRIVTLAFGMGLALAAGLCGCDGGDSPAAPARSASQGAAGDVSYAIPADLATVEGSDAPDLDLDSGRELFLATCSACHGAAGQGMPNQGPDLRHSEVVERSSDEQILAIVVRGSTPGQPGNKSGLAMPPRGGNGALSDRQIGQIIKYVRSVQVQSAEPSESTGVQHE